MHPQPLHPAAPTPALAELSGLRPHPRAAVIPDLPRGEYEALLADIRERGLCHPLEINAAGTVLDGRHRLRAAHQLALTHVPVITLEVEDEIEHMLRAALIRRQLTESQRAALVVELQSYSRQSREAVARSRANLRQHAEVASLPPRGEKTRELAARSAGCGARTVQDAATVHKHDPDLFQKVKAGTVSASQAARTVRRRHRDAQIPPAPPLPEGPFQLIYADPPWQLGNPSSAHAPEQHYPTLPTPDICALPVPAADDAVLFLWAVSSLLPDALQVMASWGFVCKSSMVWVKPSIKLGVWVRNRHELLLVGRRGTHPPPDPQDRVDSVIEAPCGCHSQKPTVVYQLLERMYPHASKLELFARNSRPGWVAWGNEVPA